MDPPQYDRVDRPYYGEIGMTKSVEYVILGSGIAGAAAAESIRSKDPEASIRMISAERDLCFNRPMLIREFALDGSGASLFEKQQDWPEQFNVQVSPETRVISIDRKKKKIHVAKPADQNGESEETVGYDKLIYALGAEAYIPPIAGADRENVFVVRTRDDMRKIRQSMRNAKTAVVIGGGMLGLEDAWALREEKMEVAIIEQKQRVAFGQIDQSAGNLMKKRIERMGVPVYLNAEVNEIGKGYVAVTAKSEAMKIPADIVILSTGVSPCGSLGEDAGLETSGDGDSGCRWIAVDERCRTSDPDIFAAGDCAATDGRNDAIWDEARQMGRVAGTNAAAGLERDMIEYVPVTAEHVFTGFDTEIFTMADSSGEGTEGVYIRHADVEIFDYQRERYIRVSLQDGVIAGILLINAPELAPELMDAYYEGAGEEEARRIIQRWKDNHDVDFKPAAPFKHR